MERFEPVETVVGTISGRDAIYLDDVLFDYQKNSAELIGQFNSSLCSRLGDDEFVDYSLTFEGVLAFTITELDLSTSFGISNFDRVVDSEWLAGFRESDHSAKVKPNHQHFRIATYDDVIEVVCNNWSLRIGARYQGR
jgi:hypothetical protein